MKDTEKVKIEPSVRIQRVGFDISVSNIKSARGRYQHQICLVRDGRVICRSEPVRRLSGEPLAVIEQRLRSGNLLRWAHAYSTLVSLADVAEQLAQESV